MFVPSFLIHWPQQLESKGFQIEWSVGGQCRRIELWNGSEEGRNERYNTHSYPVMPSLSILAWGRSVSLVHWETVNA